MLDAPLDGVVLWTGLGLVSVVALGLVLALSATAPPDAAAVADAIDRVAASQYEASGTIDVSADAIRLGSSRVSIRRASRTTHAALAAGPVTPVGDGRLRRLLRGRPPRAEFDSQQSFRRALERYPAGSAEWQAVPARLRVRSVQWGEVDATLVG